MSFAGFVGRLRRQPQVTIERHHVRGESGRIQLDERPIGHDDRPRRDTRWFKLVPKGGERQTEAVTRRGEFGLRPEELDQGFPRVTAPVVGDVRQNSGRLLGPEPRNELLTPAKTQATEQLYRPERFHGAPPREKSD